MVNFTNIFRPEIISVLARFSISAKLFAIVSFLFLVIAIIGGFAFFQMRSINMAAQDIQAQWLPSVRWIGEMRVQSARFRAVLRDYLILPDSERAYIDKNSRLARPTSKKRQRPTSHWSLRLRSVFLQKSWKSSGKSSSLRQSMCNPLPPRAM